MNVYKTDNNELILLIKDPSTSALPRLYKLKHTKKLEETLSAAMNNLNKGLNMIGVIDQKLSNNNYGIYFRTIKKQLPTK